jgi:hypothetical protein
MLFVLNAKRAGKLGTDKVTATVGEFKAPGAVTVMVPLYVPAASPAVFTETVTAPGVVPEPGLTDNQV